MSCLICIKSIPGINLTEDAMYVFQEQCKGYAIGILQQRNHTKAEE
jgi:hypothetical protein